MGARPPHRRRRGGRRCRHRRGQQRGSRLPQMVAASVVFPTVFRQARPRAGSVVLRARQV